MTIIWNCLYHTVRKGRYDSTSVQSDRDDTGTKDRNADSGFLSDIVIQVCEAISLQQVAGPAEESLVLKLV